MKKFELLDKVTEGLTTRELSDYFNKSQTTIIYWLRKYNLKTRRSTGKTLKENTVPCRYCGKPTAKRNTFCSNQCGTDYGAVEFGKRWEQESDGVLSDTIKKYGLITAQARRFIFIKYKYACSKCGWTHDCGDGRLPPLHCNHKDGNSKNNNLENIELLCPNCHAIETRLNPTPKGDGRWANGRHPHQTYSVK